MWSLLEVLAVEGPPVPGSPRDREVTEGKWMWIQLSTTRYKGPQPKIMCHIASDFRLGKTQALLDLTELTSLSWKITQSLWFFPQYTPRNHTHKSHRIDISITPETPLHIFSRSLIAIFSSTWLYAFIYVFSQPLHTNATNVHQSALCCASHINSKTRSQYRPLEIGPPPQGTKLGPLLWLICVNDLSVENSIV